MEISDGHRLQLHETTRSQATSTVAPPTPEPEVAETTSSQLPADAPDDLRFQAELHDRLKALNDDSRIELPEPDQQPQPEPTPAPPAAPEAEPSPGAEPAPEIEPQPEVETHSALPDWRVELERTRVLQAEALQQRLSQIMQLPTPPSPPPAAVEAPADESVQQLRTQLASHGLQPDELDQVFSSPNLEEQGQRLNDLLRSKGMDDDQIVDLFSSMVPEEVRQQVHSSSETLNRLHAATGLTPQELADILQNENGDEALLEQLRSRGHSEDDILKILNRTSAEGSDPRLEAVRNELSGLGLGEMDLMEIMGLPEQDRAQRLTDLLQQQGLSDEQIQQTFQRLNPPDNAQNLLDQMRQSGLSDDDVRALLQLPEDARGAAIFDALVQGGMSPDQAAETLGQNLPPQPPGAEEGFVELLKSHGVSQQELTALFEGPEEGRAERLEQLLSEKGLTPDQLDGLLQPPGEISAQDMERAQAFVNQLEQKGISASEIGPLLSDPEAFTQRLKDSGMTEDDIARLMAELQPPVDGPAALTQEEADRIGKGLQGRPPQTFWVDRAINTLNERGQQQGILSEEARKTNQSVTEKLFSPHLEVDPNAPRTEVPPAILAASARDAGLSLEKLDPNQLLSATRFINEGGSLQEQRERMTRVLDNLTILNAGKLPQLEVNDVKGILWDMARVGGHSIDNIARNPSDLQRAFEDVAQGFNAGAGDYKVKIGKHDVKFTVDESQGYVEGSGSTKGPGFWGTVGPILKTAVTAGAVAASFLIPGAAGATVALVLRGASAAISAVDAVRSGSVLGAVGAIAAGVGVGLGGVAQAAGAAGKGLETAAKTANLVARGSQGIQAIQSGSIAGLAGGILNLVGSGTQALGLGGVSGTALDKLASVSQKAGNNLMYVGAVEGVISSSRQVGTAQAALEAARASGDPQAIEAAQQQLDEARRSRTSSLLGGIAVGLSAAGERLHNQQLQIAARGANLGKDLATGNFAGIGSAVLGIAATRTDSVTMREFSQLADAGSNFAASVLAERKANESVRSAEAELFRARNSGNPEAIAAAEASLDKARQGASSAALDAFFSGDRLADTAGQVDSRREFRGQMRQQLAPDLDSARAAVAKLEELRENPRAQGGLAALLEQGVAGVAAAGQELAEAINSGDPARVAAAQQHLREARLQADQRANLLAQVMRPIDTVSAEIGNKLELRELPPLPLIPSPLGDRLTMSDTPGQPSSPTLPGATRPGAPRPQGTPPGGSAPGGSAPLPPGLSAEQVQAIQNDSEASGFFKNFFKELNKSGSAADKLAKTTEALRKEGQALSGSNILTRARDLLNQSPGDSGLRKLVGELEDLQSRGKLGLVGAGLGAVAMAAKGDPVSLSGLGSSLSILGKSQDVAKVLSAGKAAEVIAKSKTASQALQLLNSAAGAKIAGKVVGSKVLGPAGDIVGAVASGRQAVSDIQSGNTGGAVGNSMQSIGGLATGAAGATALLVAAGIITAPVSGPVLAAIALGGTVLTVGGIAVDWIWGKPKK